MNNCRMCERDAEQGNHMGFIGKGTDYEFGNVLEACQAPMPITLCEMHYSQFLVKYSVNEILGAYIREAVSA